MILDLVAEENKLLGWLELRWSYFKNAASLFLRCQNPELSALRHQRNCVLKIHFNSVLDAVTFTFFADEFEGRWSILLWDLEGKRELVLTFWHVITPKFEQADIQLKG